MVGEVERLGQGDQLALFDLQRPFERFELLAFVEDALDQRRRLTIGVGQDRIRLCRFGRRRLRGDSRKVDPLDSGGGSYRGRPSLWLVFSYRPKPRPGSPRRAIAEAGAWRVQRLTFGSHRCASNTMHTRGAII